MSARGEPPEGSRRGGPDGEDEFRVVFDESFVQAAVLHEPSAQERLRTGRKPRPLRRAFGMPPAMFRAVVLVLSIVVVTSGALYLAGRRANAPVHRTAPGPAVLVRVSLAPAVGVVPAEVAPDADPFAGTSAAAWRDDRAGIALPAQEETEHFSAPQVRESLELVRDFIADTQLDPAVWRGGRPWSAALNLRSDQYRQVIAALDHPVDDDVHAATGWVTRFDPEAVDADATLARVNAVTSIAEPRDGELMVTVDGVFVYAVKARGGEAWTRFVVHRLWEFRIDRPGLRDAQMRVRRIVTVAAPQPCTATAAAYFQPIFPAGERSSASEPTGAPTLAASAEAASAAKGAMGGPTVTASEAAVISGATGILPTPMPSPMPPASSSGPLPSGSPLDPLALGGASGMTCGGLTTAV
ncbi:MAG TPA: hypothetical protein VLH10_24000 [Yinghuangia sp.]|nr:hypothetical protein [Yinghuangia sp.]